LRVEVMLSVRAKEAIKTALAVTLAYGTAFYLGWDHPSWAGIAVLMVSLSTAGQSLNKAGLRMLGTLLAAVVALTLLALFPQDRWGFLVALSLYLGFCTYMLSGPKRSYFWFCAGFVCLIIMVDGASSPANAFETAVVRTQETGLGIALYSVIAALLWPRRSGPELERTSRALFATQRGLYQAYRELSRGRGSLEDARPLETQQVQQLPQLAPALAGAESDTFEVWELRHTWRRFSAECTQLREILSLWRESLPELERIDLDACLPNLGDVFAEIDARFTEIEGMLAGAEPTREPAPITPSTDAASLDRLKHLEKAALAVALTQLRALSVVSEALFETTRELRKPTPAPETGPVTSPASGFRIDPERFGAAVSVGATVWLAFLIWVYVDPPGHSHFVQIAGSIAMGRVMTGLAAQSMLVPFAFGSVACALFYVFVMPQLSGFTELAPAMFGAIFLVYYVFWQPQQALMKLATGICFVALIPIQNEQTYSFAAYANSAVMLMLSVSLVIVTAWIPHSPRPEKQFLRLLARFFRHTEVLMSRLAPEHGQRPGVGRRWQEALYGGDLQALPQKLAALSPRLDYSALPGSSAGQVRDLVTSLQALAYRLQELDEVRPDALENELVRELSEEVRAWRDVIARQFARLGDDPTQPLDAPATLRARLDARLEKLEARVDETVGLARHGGATPADYETFYRLLGSARGMSEAALAYWQLASDIRWAPWQEARF
jgi:uncharacterized membrane protein YccC